MPKLSSLSPHLLDICATKKCLNFAQRGQSRCYHCQLLWEIEKLQAKPPATKWRMPRHITDA